MNTRTRLLLTLAFSIQPLAFFVGCATIEGRRTPDGTLTIRSTRILWASQKVDFSVKDGTNNTISFRVTKSSSDAEALSAITEAATRGAVHGVVGP